MKRVIQTEKGQGYGAQRHYQQYLSYILAERWKNPKNRSTAKNRKCIFTKMCVIACSLGKRVPVGSRKQRV